MSGIRTTTPIRRTTPHSSPWPRPMTVRGSVPAILVGTWSGGSEGETAGTSYTFASDGRFVIRRPGGSITGVAVARSGTITFSFSGKSVTSKPVPPPSPRSASRCRRAGGPTEEDA